MVGSGVVRPITRYGEAVLHAPCAPVTSFDGELEQLIADMFASMYAAQGVGLAANQIGVGRRVFVYDCPDDDDVRHVGHVINPVIVSASALAGTVVHSEGCLSVPGPRADLERAALATITGVDHTGAARTVSGTGYFARCLQHETDHLDGIVYIDRLEERERQAILRAAGLPVSRP